jgi:hypothetical protein
MTDEEFKQLEELAGKFEDAKDRGRVAKAIQSKMHPVFQDINDGGRAAANKDNEQKVASLTTERDQLKTRAEKAEGDLKDLDGKAPDATKLRRSTKPTSRPSGRSTPVNFRKRTRRLSTSAWTSPNSASSIGSRQKAVRWIVSTPRRCWCSVRTLSLVCRWMPSHLTSRCSSRARRNFTSCLLKGVTRSTIWPRSWRQLSRRSGRAARFNGVLPATVAQAAGTAKPIVLTQPGSGGKTAPRVGRRRRIPVLAWNVSADGAPNTGETATISEGASCPCHER